MSGCFQLFKTDNSGSGVNGTKHGPVPAISGTATPGSLPEIKNNDMAAVSNVQSHDQSGNETQLTVKPLAVPLTSLSSPEISVAGQQKVVSRHGDLSYENATISEDVTWHGTVFVRGALLVSSQATVRIQPGTVVRFAKSAISRQAPRMVVMGRLHCEGRRDKPVLFTTDSVEAARGEWGGILFLNTEKKNQLEHFQIEGADIALEAHHSNLLVNGGLIKNSLNGIFLYDSNANLSGLSISNTETGLEINNSEADLREVVLSGNRKGLVAVNSSLTAVSTRIKGSLHYGMSLSECRLKIRSSDFAENTVGAIIRGGEGQLLRTRFVKNRELALDLAGARIRVNSSTFVGNQRDAVKVADNRSILYGNAFIGNIGNNLVNSGADRLVAIQNWWGSREESHISEKLLDKSTNTRPGRIIFSPWLMEKPSTLP